MKFILWRPSEQYNQVWNVGNIKNQWLCHNKPQWCLHDKKHHNFFKQFTSQTCPYHTTIIATNFCGRGCWGTKHSALATQWWAMESFIWSESKIRKLTRGALPISAHCHLYSPTTYQHVQGSAKAREGLNLQTTSKNLQLHHNLSKTCFPLIIKKF